MYTQRHWGKADRTDNERIHLLEHHLADVAACFEALLEQPTVRSRLARTADLDDLDAVTVARLCVLVALHDIGKVNIGFQTQIWRPEDLSPYRKKPLPMGHITDLVPVLEYKDEETAEWFSDELEASQLLEWDKEGGATASGLLIAALSHHGSPLNLSASCAANPAGWRPFGDLNPRHCLNRIFRMIRNWFPAAFAVGGAPLPSAPAFQHMFLGLCTLADWLGSDDRLFEFSDRPQDDYFQRARERARKAVSEIGLAPGEQRNALQELPDFAALFDIDGIPNTMQTVTADLPLDEQLIIIESETGSGKTEAALWRFGRMFQAGLVDGLYFALPTRTAATQIHKRLKTFVRNMFPDDYTPEVVLAVPGHLQAGSTTGRRLPRFEVLWDDQHSAGDAVIRRRWAAESAKRFLAAQIAVGTIDQAMMAALQVRHAHVRAACLARSLLVVDEVHASDQYMRAILEHLLEAHLNAGGYACLMSATLGSVARQRLSAPSRVAAGDTVPLDEAIAARYPAITTRGEKQEQLIKMGEGGRSKTLQVETVTEMGEFAAVAARAVAAARLGAKILIIRNTVGHAVKTQHAVEEAARSEQEDAAETKLLFSCNGVPATHHGRYAAEDRRQLDDAVEEQIGRKRGPGGRIVVGTQTLEQSLDIDADLLITDLCPMDVLLQRIGRLHRHQRTDRPKPYRRPACLVLVPADADLSPFLTRRQDTNGLGPNGFVYEDLRILEATKRLIDEHEAADSPWTIPQMNRKLVERATHPDALNAITAEMGDDWTEHAKMIEGAFIADNLAARQVLLRRNRSFYKDNREVVFPDAEMKVRTRLGNEGVEISLKPAAPSPFADHHIIEQIVIPGHLAHGLSGEEPVPWIATDDGFVFAAGERSFRYDRLGLRQL